MDHNTLIFTATNAVVSVFMVSAVTVVYKPYWWKIRMYCNILLEKKPRSNFACTRI